MKGRTFLLIGCALIWMTACQRNEPMEQRQGLDNDSHSYSYVSYADNKMRQAALNVKGVKDVLIKYNGRNIMLYVIPKKQIDPVHYPFIAEEVRKKVQDAAPQNPFHVRVLRAQDYFEHYITQ
jgi:tRNA 2-selenouridine synthase SelU